MGVYITARWPDEGKFSEYLDALRGVADFVEVGVPTDNPKYDGPFIRLSHRSVKVKGLEALRGLGRVDNLVVMAYAEDFADDLEGLFRAARDAGAASVLLPDLLVDFPDLLEAYVAKAREHGLAPSFFLPSKFPHSLAARLASFDPLFIYLGLYAATGIRLPVYVERNIKAARELIGDVYLVAGFAIDSAERAKSLIAAGADGVVVGTAAMVKLGESLKRAVSFLREVKAAISDERQHI